MARQVQLRRGTTAQNNTFTGAEGEITMDTTNKTLRVHDGTTQGGTMLAKQSDIPSDIGAADYVVATQLPTAANNYTWYRKYKSGWVEQGCYIYGIAPNKGEFIFTFPKPYSGQHTYFIVATGAIAGIVWGGGAKRTAASCVIQNTANETNYVDVYTCGMGA